MEAANTQNLRVSMLILQKIAYRLLQKRKVASLHKRKMFYMHAEADVGVDAECAV